MTASVDNRRAAVDFAAALTAEEWQEFVRESRSTGCSSDRRTQDTRQRRRTNGRN